MTTARAVAKGFAIILGIVVLLVVLAALVDAPLVIRAIQAVISAKPHEPVTGERRESDCATYAAAMRKVAEVKATLDLRKTVRSVDDLTGLPREDVETRMAVDEARRQLRGVEQWLRERAMGCAPERPAGAGGDVPEATVRIGAEGAGETLLEP